MARFRSQELQVETKPDLTPVTDADRDAEQVPADEQQHGESDRHGQAPLG